jgi:hypothetical protein
LGRKHIYLPHAQTAIYDSKVKLFLKQGISHQLGRDAVVRFECENSVKIQYCPISSKFYMWVDNDVPTLKNFYRSLFSKWSSQYRTNSTVAAILKMETGRNLSMSGINSGHHNLPTYEISLKSNNVEVVF